MNDTIPNLDNLDLYVSPDGEIVVAKSNYTSFGQKHGKHNGLMWTMTIPVILDIIGLFVIMFTSQVMPRPVLYGLIFSLTGLTAVTWLVAPFFFLKLKRAFVASGIILGCFALGAVVIEASSFMLG